MVGVALETRMRAVAGRLQAMKFNNYAVDTLFQFDGVTLTIDRLPERKFKVRSGTSSIDTTIKADEVLEARYRGGILHVLRRARLDDPEDLPPDPNSFYLGDDYARPATRSRR